MIRTTLIALVGVLVLTAPTGAYPTALPTLTVVPFTPDRLNEKSRKSAEELADDLAAQLAESGRYRVLAREWMPLPIKGKSGPYPVATLRQAAAHAGVQYIVFGSLHLSTRRSVSYPLTTYLPVKQGGLFTRIALARMQRPKTKDITSYSVEIEVVATDSGELVRTMRSRGETGTRPLMADAAEALKRLSAQLGHAQ